MPRKILFLIGVGIFLPAFWIGCEESSQEMGSDWFTPNTRMVMIDTCTVEISSFLLDSVPTSGGGRIFSGIFRSPYWGETRVTHYVTFQTTTDYTFIDEPQYKETVRFDSLTLVLRPDSMFCGDTTRLMTLHLHRLSEEVEFAEDNYYLYGHSSFSYEAQPLVSHSFYPKPYRGREMEIRLPDALGEEFLELLVNREDEVQNSTNFIKYFNGLAFVPDESSQAILGFHAADTTCYMRLHYRVINHHFEERQADFKMQVNNNFHQVQIDRSGTPLEGITFENNELHSRQTDNKAYVQGLTGIYTKIEFPHLNKIQELGSYGYVVSALLRVYPLPGSYDQLNYSEIPQTLRMYVSSELNVTTGAITNSNEEVQGGSLVYDVQFPKETYYTYDITEFIQQQLGKNGVNKLSLQMIGDDYGYTLRDLVVGNQELGSENIVLYITYAMYNEN